MSLGYEVRAIDSKGVGLFATKVFSDGDIIFEERPLLAAQFWWNELLNYPACHHCIRPLEIVEENVRRLTKNSNIVVPFPELCTTDKSKHSCCENCGVRYCSDICKQSALNQYHRSACPGINDFFKELDITWKKIYFPSITLLVKIVASVNQSDDKESLIASLLEFSHGMADDVKSKFLKIFEPENNIDFTVLHKQIAKAFPGENKFLTEDGIKTLLALIGRNGQGIITSPLGEWVLNARKQNPKKIMNREINSIIKSIFKAIDKGTYCHSQGSGLYKLHRCMNHSCLPNAVVTFPYSDSKLVLVAMQKIEPGDEICISYLDEKLLDQSRHSRNKKLKDHYLFECSCSKCQNQADDPDLSSEDEKKVEKIKNKFFKRYALKCNLF